MDDNLDSFGIDRMSTVALAAGYIMIRQPTPPPIMISDRARMDRLPPRLTLHVRPLAKKRGFVLERRPHDSPRVSYRFTNAQRSWWNFRKSHLDVISTDNQLFLGKMGFSFGLFGRRFKSVDWDYTRLPSYDLSSGLILASPREEAQDVNIDIDIFWVVKKRRRLDSPHILVCRDQAGLKLCRIYIDHALADMRIEYWVQSWETELVDELTFHAVAQMEGYMSKHFKKGTWTPLNRY